MDGAIASVVELLRGANETDLQDNLNYVITTLLREVDERYPVKHSPIDNSQLIAEVKAMSVHTKINTALLTTAKTRAKTQVREARVGVARKLNDWFERRHAYGVAERELIKAKRTKELLKEKKDILDQLDERRRARQLDEMEQQSRMTYRESVEFPSLQAPPPAPASAQPQQVLVIGTKRMLLAASANRHVRGLNAKDAMIYESNRIVADATTAGMAPQHQQQLMTQLQREMNEILAAGADGGEGEGQMSD